MKKLITAVFLFTLCSAFIIAESVTTTININNARQTSNQKDEETGNDLIILEGSVQLSVQNGSSTSEIKADRITYDRVTEILFAEGNVEITTKSSGSGGETTTAKSLLLNTSTLEGVFDDGRVIQTQSDAINLPSGSTLIVFSDLMGKSLNNTIAFKNSSLTFCDDENPHWKINASRTWLLPGGEFAFFNALLYVGVVPVFYFPAFYYPKDELVFNPVFSTRNREGYAIQTTTYLIGRKPLESSSSSSAGSSSSSDGSDSLKALYNFMKPSSLKEQKLEGLVLHNLDQDYTGDTSKYLKFMADWYSRLGYMVGVDGSFTPKNNFISSIKFNTYLGMSNTIYYNSGKYTGYNPYNGQITKDESYFMGLRMPFRYGMNYEMALTKPFKLNISLPVYSDPFFSYDYLQNRSETMDWISYFINQQDTETVSINEVTSFAWKLNGSYSPAIPAVLKPYINSASISFNSSFDFASKSADFSKTPKLVEGKPIGWTSSTPLRKFYYPSSVTPLSASFSMSGTIVQYPKSNSSSSSTKASYIFDLNKPDQFKTQKELDAEEAERQKAAQTEKSENGEDKIAAAEDLKNNNENAAEEPFLPSFIALDTSNSSISNITPFSYKLDYSLNSNLSSQVTYDASKVNYAGDFDWKDIKSTMYTVKMPVNINSNMNFYGNYFTMNNGLSYSPIWQRHPNTIGYTEAEKKSVMLSDYKAESQTVTNTNSVSYKPFVYTDMFKDTGLSWNSTIRVYQHKFIGDADNPEWENKFIDFEDKECITVNTVNMTLAMNELDNKLKQSIVFSSILPPLLRQYTATLNLTFPYTSFTLSSGFKEPVKDADFKDWTKNPLQQSFSFTKTVLGSSLKFSESYNYNLEKKYSDSLKLGFSWYNFTFSYVYSYTNGSKFEGEDSGWVLNDEKKFRPYSMSFAYSLPAKTYYTWFNRITFAPGLSTSLTADLIRPTNSYFTITPSVTFKINQFFNLTFSSTSKNAVLYRYVQKAFGHEGLVPGEENIFKDLLNSFAFGDRSKREASGFKLKSLNMTMSHDLHDWSFNLTMKVEPRMVVDGAKKYYDFSPYLSIGIVWNPMESMKTTIVREAKTTNSPEMIWKLNAD